MEGSCIDVLDSMVTVSILPDWAYSVRLLLSFLLPAGLLLGVTYLWQLYVLTTQDNASSLPLPPGRMGLPLIGETISLIMKGSKFHKERQASYGNVFKTHILGKPTIRIIGSENVRKILMNEHHLVRSVWPTSTRKILGENTLSMSLGDQHKLRKKFIMKAFTHDALSGYVPSIQSRITSYLTEWSHKDMVLGYLESRRLMFSIACRTLLGFHMTNAEELKMLTVFETITKNILSLPIYLPGTGLYKGLKARETLMNHIDHCIKKRQDNPDDMGMDGLSAMLEHVNSGSLSKDELKDAVLELLFAGHATLSSAACSTMMHLGKNPHVVHRAFAEIADHNLDFSVEDGTSPDLTYDAVNRLTYVNNIVNEVLRLVPPVGGAFREAIKTFEINGHQIPKGWSVNYSIRETQQCSGHFNDIETFNPDRWDSAKEQELKRNFQFIPFGGGPRSCAGRQYAKLVLKIFVVELVRNYTMKLLNENAEMVYFPIPKPKDYLPVRIQNEAGFRRRARTL